MRAFEWKEFFNVGHEAMDVQHQRLFAIVNELDAGLQRPDGTAEAVLEKTLVALCEYTRIHFAEEEHLMLMAEFPDYAQHKQEHDDLIGKIEEFEARMRNGDVRLVAEVLPFLVGEWLAHHIAFEDQRYAGYIGSHTSKLHQKYASAADLYPWRQSESELAEA